MICSEEEQMNTFLIITLQILPIPDVMGGGTENVVTSLIDVNEEKNEARFIVTSNYNAQAAASEYNKSKIYYFDHHNIICNQDTGKAVWKWSLRHFLFRIRRKIFHNRFTRRIFGSGKDMYDFMMDQYIWIAKKEKADYVITYEESRIDRYERFNRLLGKDRVYFHVICHNKENLAIRSVIHNSLSISKFVLSEWVKDTSIAGNNAVLYNGSRLARYKNPFSNAERQKRREELAIQEDDFVVVFVGRMIPVKGVAQILEAFERMRELHIKLILIGSPLFAKNLETDFSRTMREKAQKMNNVIYLGYVPNEDLFNYYGISDAQLVPSIWQEGAGLVTIEGMAAGLPLIVTDSGGMIEYVDDNCAIKVPIDDNLPDHLATEIIRLSQDKERCKKMSEAGKKRSELFSSEALYDNFLAVFGGTTLS